MGAAMRGSDEQNGALFSYVNLEDRVPARHPLRVIRQIVNTALVRLDAAFADLYAAEGRPSIPPERLLRAVLIQILFSIRSERQLIEQMQYNLLFRWFVGLGIDDPVWVPTVFSKNRDRLLTTDIARQLLAAILADKAVKPLLSDETSPRYIVPPSGLIACSICSTLTPARTGRLTISRRKATTSTASAWRSPASAPMKSSLSSRGRA
jgi:transposase